MPMPRTHTLFFRKPTPKHFAAAIGALGVFGLIGYIGSPLPGIPRVTVAYFTFTSTLMIVSGIALWHPSRVGWWLSWCTMLAIAVSGVLPFGVGPYLHFHSSRALQAGFMSIGAGLFFSTLSRPELQRECFEPGRAPHPILLRTPAILILVGVGLVLVDRLWFLLA